MSDVGRRAGVLRQGHARFPAHSGLADELCVAAWAAGRPDEALLAARQVIAAEPERVRPWFIATQSLASVRDQGELTALLDRFAARFMGKPDVVADLVSLASGLVRDGSDPVASRALEWTGRLLAERPTAVVVAMARARMLAAIDRWDEALALTDGARLGAPDHPGLLRLRAELLSYSGAVEEALRAYDAYFAAVPDDLGAMRQQARVAGWGQHYRRSRSIYDEVVSRAPAMAAVAAERDAKAGLYRGAWSRSVSAYRRWLELEPGDREARFELAQSLDRSGNLAGADREYALLATSLPLHRQAVEARGRLAQRSAWHAGPLTETESSDGYVGQRLLDRVRSGVGASSALGPATPWGFGAGAAWRRATAPGFEATGYDASLSVDRRVARRAVFGATAGVESNDSRDGRPLLVGRAGVNWLASDHWRIEAGAERRSFLENARTLRDRLTLTGFEAALAKVRPSWGLALRESSTEVSDGNRRHDARIDGRLRLFAGRNELALVGATEYFSFEHEADRYFSPGGFWRHDAGAEWRHHFRLPRFASDRQQEMSVAYFYGVDNRDETYRTAHADLSVELASGARLGGRVLVIRSDVYRNTSAALSFDLSPRR